jgi:hypothetical protein
MSRALRYPREGQMSSLKGNHDRQGRVREYVPFLISTCDDSLKRSLADCHSQIAISIFKTPSTRARDRI